MLKSEVEDLRILIQAADKEVDSLKRARNNDAIEGGRRYAGLESKVNTKTSFKHFLQIGFVTKIILRYQLILDTSYHPI